MHANRFFFILGLIATAMISRFLPHPPNFTAINAVALFSVCTLGSRVVSLAILYVAMLLSDMILGFHSQMLFVYLSLTITIIMKGFRLPFLLSLASSSLLFFMIVNFGVWLVDGIYPMTSIGLGCCYINALPFLGNQLFGDFFYGIALFGSLAIGEKLAPSIKYRPLPL